MNVIRNQTNKRYPPAPKHAKEIHEMRKQGEKASICANNVQQTSYETCYRQLRNVPQYYPFENRIIIGTFPQRQRLMLLTTLPVWQKTNKTPPPPKEPFGSLCWAANRTGECFLSLGHVSKGPMFLEMEAQMFTGHGVNRWQCCLTSPTPSPLEAKPQRQKMMVRGKVEQDFFWDKQQQSFVSHLAFSFFQNTV